MAPGVLLRHWRRLRHCGWWIGWVRQGHGFEGVAIFMEPMIYAAVQSLNYLLASSPNRCKLQIHMRLYDMHIAVICCIFRKCKGLYVKSESPFGPPLPSSSWLAFPNSFLHQVTNECSEAIVASTAKLDTAFTQVTQSLTQLEKIVPWDYNSAMIHWPMLGDGLWYFMTRCFFFKCSLKVWVGSKLFFMLENYGE